MDKLVVFTATYDEAQNVDAWLDGVREAAPWGKCSWWMTTPLTALARSWIREPKLGCH